MPRSTSRGRGWRRSLRRHPETVKVTCKECGRPFGYLTQAWAVEGPGRPIIWWGRTPGFLIGNVLHGDLGPELAGPPGEPPDGLAGRFRYRCECGAMPVYTAATLQAEYRATAGTVAL